MPIPKGRHVRFLLEVPVPDDLEEPAAIVYAAKLLDLDVKRATQLAPVVNCDVRSGRPGELEVLRIESIVSSRDGTPRVNLRWHDHDMQMTPAEVEEHCRKLLNASHGAVTDAFLMRFLTEKIEADEGTAATIMHEFRGYRKALEERGHA